MLTATAYNTAGLLALRFFLGVAEAPIGPGLSVCIAMWYKRSEQPLRHAAWFLGNSLGGIIGGLIAYGIGHIDTFSPWKVSVPLFPLQSILRTTKTESIAIFSRRLCSWFSGLLRWSGRLHSSSFCRTSP